MHPLHLCISWHQLPPCVCLVFGSRSRVFVPCLPSVCKYLAPSSAPLKKLGTSVEMVGVNVTTCILFSIFFDVTYMTATVQRKGRKYWKNICRSRLLCVSWCPLPHSTTSMNPTISWWTDHRLSLLCPIFYTMMLSLIKLGSWTRNDILVAMPCRFLRTAKIWR